VRLYANLVIIIVVWRSSQRLTTLFSSFFVTMLPIVITQVQNTFTLRTLSAQDSSALAEYFERLSDESRKRFQPHPLTREHAAYLSALAHDTATRFVLLSGDSIIGYFILESEMSVHEAGRYAAHGIELTSERDILFAPSILDEYQNHGLASLVMPKLLEWAKERHAKSLVLMGGTQETNGRAIAFYEKFGFQKHGGYHTEMFNHDMRLVL
jgi:GNAT superfamily N-acetyltransferase